MTARNARTSLTCNCAQKKSTRTNRCALWRRRCQKNCISLPLSRGRRKRVQFSQDIRPVAPYCPKGKSRVVFLHRKCAFAGSKKTKNCNLMTSGKLNVSRKKQKEKEKKCYRLLPQKARKLFMTLETFPSFRPASQRGSIGHASPYPPQEYGKNEQPMFLGGSGQQRDTHSPPNRSPKDNGRRRRGRKKGKCGQSQLSIIFPPHPRVVVRIEKKGP